ncbi:hypothetical protein K502DRAFT_317649 [Neoconidiobolus thromboides FSU 785]|nr:hypothetical protein K502DRAFT_317649 [Neoconidiobolus thromboides FSU 785]
MSLSKNNKLINLLNYRLRVTLIDKRVFTGQMMAFDTHMNLVIADCEEFRKTKAKEGKEQVELKRTLGLVILRGEHIVTISVDGPPPPNSDPSKNRMNQLAPGTGVGRPAGRGIPAAPPAMAPAGLAGPVRGVGGPAPGMMLPRGPGQVPVASAAPIPYGRPPPPGVRPGMPPVGYRPGMPPGPGGFRPGGPLPPGMRPPPGGMPFPPPPPMGRGGPPQGFNPPPPFRPPPRN